MVRKNLTIITLCVLSFLVLGLSFVSSGEMRSCNRDCDRGCDRNCNRECSWECDWECDYNCDHHDYERERRTYHEGDYWVRWEDYEYYRDLDYSRRFRDWEYEERDPRYMDDVYFWDKVEEKRNRWDCMNYQRGYFEDCLEKDDYGDKFWGKEYYSKNYKKEPLILTKPPIGKQGHRFLFFWVED